MTWELAAAMIAAGGFLISLGGVLVRVAKNLSDNTSAVLELRRFMEKQAEKNREFYRELNEHNERLIRIEERCERGCAHERD